MSTLAPPAPGLTGPRAFGNAVALPLGAVSSLALHAGIALAVIWAVTPLPRPPQEVPQAEMAVEAWQVTRSEAAEARPETEAAREDAAAGDSLASGAVPQDRARLAAAAPERAAAAAPEAERPPPESPEAERPAAATAAPERPAGAALAPERSAAAAPPAERPAAAIPAPERPVQARPEAERPAAAPPPAAIAPVAAPVAVIAPAAPPSAALAPAAARPEPLPAAAAAPAPAAPARIEAAPLPAAAPPAAPAPAAELTAEPARPAAPPEAPALAAAPAAPEPAAAAAPEAEPAAPAGIAADPAPAARPEPLPAAAAEPGAEPVAPAQVLADAAAPAAPEAEPAPATIPEAERGRATLAPLGPDGRLDPKSLEAIAALTAPADPGSAAAELQDGLAGLLGDVPCARMQLSFDPDTGEMVLRGNIPDPALEAAIAAGLTQRIGAGIPVSVDLRHLPEPQCQALAGIDAVGLPQSTDQYTNERIIGPDAFVVERDFAGGEPLDLDLGGADYDAWIYFDYYMADGQVLHFIPSAEIPLEWIPAFGRSEVLRKKDGRGPLGLVVGPPYGREIAVAFASSVPLYEGLRPMVEPAGEYLSFLREQVAAARAEHADFKGEWVYFLITTHE